MSEGYGNCRQTLAVRGPRCTETKLSHGKCLTFGGARAIKRRGRWLLVELDSKHNASSKGTAVCIVKT